jgi:hypothetical protein
MFLGIQYFHKTPYFDKLTSVIRETIVQHQECYPASMVSHLSSWFIAKAYNL